MADTAATTASSNASTSTNTNAATEAAQKAEAAEFAAGYDEHAAGDDSPESNGGATKDGKGKGDAAGMEMTQQEDAVTGDPRLNPEPTKPDTETAKPAAEKTPTTPPAKEGEEPGKEPAKDPAKEEQRLKSWEGRLKKMQADIDAKASKEGTTEADKGADVLTDAAEKMEAKGDTEGAETVEVIAEKVESGEMSLEEAMSTLAEDFGDPFIKLIERVVRGATEKIIADKFGEIEGTTKELVSKIQDREAREHFKAIESEHPDFREINADPKFKDFIGDDPERKRIAEGGSASEINSMLSEFKAEGGKSEGKAKAAGDAAETPPKTGAATTTKPAAESTAPAKENATPDNDEDEIDAAEGVRSTGMSLPTEPASSEDFVNAWKEFDEE